MENDISSKWHSEKSGSSGVLISDEIDFEIKKVKKDTEGHFIMIKRIMHQEDIHLLIPMLPIKELRNI